MESNKVTDLTTLNQLSGGDSARKEKYIHMFLNMLPGQLETAQNSLSNQDWPKLRNSVHTLKSQLGYMGVKKAQDLAQQIEKMADEQIQLEDISTWMNNFVAICHQAEIELKAEIS
jgi:HPt (histidine-containing phosphotransfer) domain-containing protein